MLRLCRKARASSSAFGGNRWLVSPDPEIDRQERMTSATPAKTSSEPAAPAFQLRGGAYTLLVLRLNDPKDPVLFQALADKIAQAPNFFRHAPVVIDLQNLVDAPPFNMAELGRRLRQHQLVPIGVQNGNEEQNRAAVNAGWSLFPEGRQAPLRENAAGAFRAWSIASAPSPRNRRRLTRHEFGDDRNPRRRHQHSAEQLARNIWIHRTGRKR